MDDTPSEEELAEAAALARALERETLGRVDLDAVLPALEAAHLLKMTSSSGPSEARLLELYAEVEASLPLTPLTSERAPANGARLAGWRGRRMSLWVVTTASLAAAVGLWFSSREPGAPRAGTLLPAPTVAMLEAQLRAVQRSEVDTPADGTDANVHPLEAPTRAYRTELLAQLASEYEP